MSIGEAVLKRRTELGWSVYRLALTTGLEASTIADIERGKTHRPTSNTLRALESALGICLGEPEKEKGPTWKKRNYRPRFALCRKATGRTQAQAAATLRVSRTTLRCWELGETSPPAWVLARIARLYGVSVDYLIGYDEKPFQGRRCKMEGPCAAGKPIDFCCCDCPDRNGCRDRCTNHPSRCGLIRTICPLED